MDLLPADIFPFDEELECDYKGEHYSVRDNGAIMRHAKGRKRPLDEVWTFGEKDVANGYMVFRNERVHRIVATAFIGSAPSPQHVVDHIDTSALGMERLMNARSYMDTLFVRSVALRPDTTATFVDIDGEAFPELQWQGVDSSLVWTLAIESDSDMLYPVLTKDISCLDPRVSGVYYYHSDHLGSAAWVTHGAQAVQFVHYMPFGEMWYNQQGSAYNERYKFTGKERDAETGYDYFGARYYASGNLSWLSVDPLADKYPNISPYAYAAWNPVNRIDPDGRDWYEAEDGTSALWKNSNDASINLNGVSYNNIGANYNHTVGNTTYGYHQNELASVTTDAMSGDNYISQFSKEDWNGTPAMKACNKACDAMLASAGFASSEHKNKNIIVENDGTGRAGIANNNAESIIGKMTDMLYAGIPSKACVDIRQGSSSADKIGDHFIVIMGIKEYISQGKPAGVSYRFFEPGTGQVKYRIGELNLVNNRLTGNAPYSNTRHYTVSSIRFSR